MLKLLIPQMLGSSLTITVLAFGVVAAAAQIPAPDDVAAAPGDADVTGSGLASKVIQAGTGSAHPTATSNVRVHYTGWLTNGTMFDSSVSRGQPIEFPLDGVIDGWTEGVQLMVVGEKRRFWIPSDLGYGPQGFGIPGGAVFDIPGRRNARLRHRAAADAGLPSDELYPRVGRLKQRRRETGEVAPRKQTRWRPRILHAQRSWRPCPDRTLAE